MWSTTRNLVRMDQGNYRSILGYAGESLAIGRALVCGYNLFFKAWRDAKYDAVLDSRGNLFRIEIKQTSGTSTLSLSSGGRAGQQIDRAAGSREKVLSTEDCDFVIGANSMNGHCWVIPVELIEIIGRKSLSQTALEHFFEKWGIFALQHENIELSKICKGFRNSKDAQLERLC